MSREILERALAICDGYARTVMANPRLLESLQSFERHASAYRSPSGASLREAVNPPNADHQVLGCASGAAFQPIILAAIYNINTDFAMVAAILAGLSRKSFSVDQVFAELRSRNDAMLYYSIVLVGYLSHAVNLSKNDYLTKYIALAAAKKDESVDPDTREKIETQLKSYIDHYRKEHETASQFLMKAAFDPVKMQERLERYIYCDRPLCIGYKHNAPGRVINDTWLPEPWASEEMKKIATGQTEAFAMKGRERRA